MYLKHSIGVCNSYTIRNTIYNVIYTLGENENIVIMAITDNKHITALNVMKMSV